MYSGRRIQEWIFVYVRDEEKKEIVSLLIQNMVKVAFYVKISKFFFF